MRIYIFIDLHFFWWREENVSATVFFLLHEPNKCLNFENQNCCRLRDNPSCFASNVQQIISYYNHVCINSTKITANLPVTLLSQFKVLFSSIYRVVRQSTQYFLSSDSNHLFLSLFTCSFSQPRKRNHPQRCLPLTFLLPNSLLDETEMFTLFIIFHYALFDLQNTGHCWICYGSLVIVSWLSVLLNYTDRANRVNKLITTSVAILSSCP